MERQTPCPGGSGQGVFDDERSPEKLKELDRLAADYDDDAHDENPDYHQSG